MTPQVLPEPVITEEQVAQFWQDGFISGIPILTERQTEIARQRFETLEAQASKEAGERWNEDQYAPWNTGPHPLQAWCHAVSNHPRILQAVSAILGPNLLIRNGDIFMKDPGNSRRIQWHVDSTAPMNESHQMVTAWLGLSKSTLENGAMQFIPGSHRMALPERNKDKHNLSFRGKDLEDLNRLPAVSNLMAPGHLSIHTFRTLHRSGGNQTALRRFGYVTRFISPNVGTEASECGQAFLAMGENTSGNLKNRPTFPVWWQRSDPRSSS
jgi:ectoine hydroxylase-related dioxygenase (phytanoyl-CoA dioxygenase family)